MHRIPCKRCVFSKIRRYMATTADVNSKIRKALLDKILRVDHAGELGANRIYQGQMAVLGKSSVGPVIEVYSSRLGCEILLMILKYSLVETRENYLYPIMFICICMYQEMWEQEKKHLQKFNELLPQYRVRPTALIPFWDVAGFALGECVFAPHLRCFGSTHAHIQCLINYSISNATANISMAY